ncbi:MAG: 16S rRNA (cytidine(1402)-2'-O)-methyltransferase [Burkholderiales bacterium]|nr:16S rRNA (cytidine(1402)-2'-O)-methyltransferase [Burkholderiales bacterium]
MHSKTSAAKEAALYVVATPVGNLQDITLRALDVLKSVQLIAAEDTRTSRHLLEHYGIPTPLTSLHEHNEAGAAQRIVEALGRGQAVALISDAGTPAISDPGAMLVRRVRAAGFPVVPVPGPSALAAAVSVAGLEPGTFLFLGFLPAQPAARRRRLEQVRALPFAVVLYEAPHRLRECIDDLAELLGGERELVIARELTKLFESVHVCMLGEAGDWIDADPNRRRGEFVLVIGPPPPCADPALDEAQRVLTLLLAEVPLKQAVRLCADITGVKRNLLYRQALALKSAQDDAP